MSPVGRFEIVLALLAAAIGLELLARRLRLPSAAALILGGIALAAIPGTPDIEIDPDLVMVLFLPPLLLAGAYFTTWRDFRADLRIILQLAIGAVAFTTLIVGWVAHRLVPGLPWAACFALGAIVSPPDAVAAKAVLHGLKLPPRVVTLLEGESLVNDATGLVLYRMAVAAALTGAFDVRQAALGFGLLSVGGVLAGIGFGLALSLAMGRLRDPKLAIVASFLGAWGSYIGGEALHVSGVLSTVACGLVLGWRQHDVLSAEARLHARAVWEVVVFILESLVFILIGLSLRAVVGRLGGDQRAVLAVLPGAAAVTAALVLARFAWIIPATYLVRAVAPGLRRRDPYPPIGIPLVMSWAGMRGVVSLAVALALPDRFPGRDFILATTFTVILVTVLVQGITLAPLIRALRLEGFAVSKPATLSEDVARARMAQAQLEAVEARSRATDGKHRHPRLMEQYDYRARAAARLSEAGGTLHGDRQEHFRTVLAAVASGRSQLLRLHRAREIHDDVLHALERELDLEETNARRFAEQEAVQT